MKLRYIAIMFLLVLPIVVSQNYTCLDNTTLRISEHIEWNGETQTLYRDRVCTYGCDLTQNQCYQGSVLNVMTITIITLFGIFLGFIRKDPIMNVIGSLMFIIFGIFMWVQGVVLNIGGYGYTDYVTKNIITQLVAISFIGFAIYKIARVMLKFYRTTEGD